ncbi:uncharacterized protein PITG_03859 [Phytophthora infestans T30-4]|uniref:Uncharacterized protein n=1 Tax=Phytophthora infestans (strain T30-4) TaxID=403677 RepID=D0MYQ2_PHYIT|nr:uncharacterized protein PITG_03859 [Phytophthora infestans T30-4]EEY66300.1 conserved hypothetical protein [Phytophthora infestans T30-4]|eukprot:XP_002906899.1 conserved hypothetical protein [Phytophthora infestans T30-4]
MTRDRLNSFIHYCSTVVKTVLSTTTVIAQGLYETASTMLLNWWSGKQEDEDTLEVVERQSTMTQGDFNVILEENNRLKRMIKFAVSSHAIMNEATSILEDGADLWVKRADVVDAKVLEAEQERDALTLQLEEYQE